MKQNKSQVLRQNISHDRNRLVRLLLFFFKKSLALSLNYALVFVPYLTYGGLFPPFTYGHHLEPS